MTENDARQVALAYVKEMERESACELALVDRCTIEKSFGWVFFYQSKRYLGTGEFSDSLAGNAPIVVAKADGRIHETGTAFPLEHYLKQLAAIQGWTEG